MPWQPVVAQYSGLVPLAAVLVYRPPAPYWLIAGGFAMSWVGDALMLESGGSWQLAHLWLPAQIGLILVAIAATWTLRALSVLGVTVMALIMAQSPSLHPDVTLTVVGSVWILYASHGRVTTSLYIYFGAGTVLYLLMLGAARAGNILPAWYVYQCCRISAYAAFVRATGGSPWTTSRA